MRRYSPSRISAVVLALAWVGLALTGLAADACAGLGARLGGVGAARLRDARPARAHERAVVPLARPDRASRATLATNLQPFVAALFAVVLLGERIDRVQVAGGLLIAAGILAARRRAPRLARGVSARSPEYACRMSPQRRTALVSVGAAVALIAIKLGTGPRERQPRPRRRGAALGHRSRRRAADLLRDRLRGEAGRPSHPYGHGKAEHLAALAEASVLSLVSIAVGALAVARLAGWIEIETSTAWWVFAAVALVLAIDLSRTVVSARAARRYASPALASNALHFGSDLVGTVAVLGGLVAVRAGWPAGTRWPRCSSRSSWSPRPRA